MSVKIAIISDIHCHVKSPKERSYLIANTKKATLHDPAKALVDMLSKQPIDNVDLLLLPGDFCDSSDERGFNYAWTNMKKIALELKTRRVVSTVGNHDVDRKNRKAPFHLPMKELSFPIEDTTMRNHYWENGYCFIDYPELDLVLLNINSSHHQRIKAELIRGKITSEQIQGISEKIDDFSDRKHKIAMCHHQPILHERSGSKPDDIMVMGSELLELLDLNSFSAIVHGHKHDPRIKYSSSGSGGTAVFAAGSFSCTGLLPGGLNTFHILELENEKIENCERQGTVETWQFIPGIGWKKEATRWLPPISGFGCVSTPASLAERTFNFLKEKTILDDGSGKFYALPWSEYLKEFPEVKYLVRQRFETFAKLCLTRYNIKLSQDLPQLPEFIHLQKSS